MNNFFMLVGFQKIQMAKNMPNLPPACIWLKLVGIHQSEKQ